MYRTRTGESLTKRPAHSRPPISSTTLREAIGQENRDAEVVKDGAPATRSEYRKVEQLTLAGFFVITLLAFTISG